MFLLASIAPKEAHTHLPLPSVRLCVNLVIITYNRLLVLHPSNIESRVSHTNEHAELFFRRKIKFFKAVNIRRTVTEKLCGHSGLL